MPLRACRPGDPGLLGLVARAVAEVPAWGALVLAARRDPRPFLIYEELGTPVGVLWGTRGPCQLVGGLYLVPERRDATAAALGEIVAHLRALPETVAVVAPATSGPLALTAALRADGFEVVERRELVHELARADLTAPSLDANIRLCPWDDRHRDPAARLLAAAYRGRIDGLFVAPPALATVETCRCFIDRVVDGRDAELLSCCSAVVLVDDELAGFNLASRDSSEQAYSCEIAVAPAQGGRGLARALARNLQRRAVDEGMRTIRFVHSAGNPGITRLFRDDEILGSTVEHWLVWTSPGFRSQRESR